MAQPIPSTTGTRPPGAVGAAVAVVLGCAALTLRPLLGRYLVNPDGALVVLFAVLLLAGVALPVPRTRPSGRVLVPLALGLAAFTTARLLGGGRGPGGPLAKLVVLNGLAAVAEEAFFRRLVFGALRAGSGRDSVAIGGSALLFALVHVTTYGFWVLPLDLAAGLVLGWQRSVTGRWSVPAITHVVANALVLL